MSEPSFASLNPALLARKGGAKPAMRPQLGPLPHSAEHGSPELEDLGWNDMGAEDSADVVSISEEVADTAQEDQPSPAKQQQELVAARLEAKTTSAPKSPAPTKKRSAKRQSKGQLGKRAAFTLRLDTDRHLRLRLASTIRGISAQALVTEALDAMLETMEDIDTLADKIQRK